MGDAVGVYEVQSGMLDEAYLDAWAEKLGLCGLLLEVRARAALVILAALCCQVRPVYFTADPTPT